MMKTPFRNTRPSMHKCMLALLALSITPLLQANPELAEQAERLELISQTRHVAAVPAREPMVVRHPQGALFLTGYWRYQDPDSELQLWRSDDEGKYWEAVDLGKRSSGGRGNSDVDLAVGPDGTLYFVAMGFDREALQGTHLTVGVSRDTGRSWHWTILSEDRGTDRPWVGVTPDGEAHVVWNDGRGVRHSVSKDKGISWTERPRISDAGGSSHFVIGSSGELAVRITPYSAAMQRYDAGVDRIAISRDGGLSWKTIAAPGERVWTTEDSETLLPRWVEPLAWDTSGRLYSLWSEGERVVLARSSDGGSHWEDWVIAKAEKRAHYPYLIARGDGEIAAAWFSGAEGELSVELAYGRFVDGEACAYAVARADSFVQPAFAGPEDAIGFVSAGEYLPLLFLSDDELAIVAVMQDAVSTGEFTEVLGSGPQGFLWKVYKVPQFSDCQQ